MTSAHYPLHPASVSKARAFVAHALDPVPEELRDCAVLVTSELATNAITHAHSAFTVSVTLTAEHVHLAVTDEGGGMPRLRHTGPTQAHGRGLLIVSSLADRWGVDAQNATTSVWCTFAVRPRATFDASGSQGVPVPDSDERS
ncbi:ATP-binding protein [Nocardioides sp. DS6]|uniref:ATP-binding protein n=1 Tax=Nocardioides eburneus TaxID=3231482 RepID=A0ABV3SW05_9ACTN